VESFLIAPCGINCSTCIAFLRKKNKCSGCMSETGIKVTHSSSCKIKNCESLTNSDSNLCYECIRFPCQRIKNIDKRYSTRYHLSLIQNLLTIKEIGMTKFLAKESIRWSCPNCGSALSVHREYCPTCNQIYIPDPSLY
jgi:hypothetical protein